MKRSFEEQQSAAINHVDINNQSVLHTSNGIANKQCSGNGNSTMQSTENRTLKRSKLLRTNGISSQNSQSNTNTSQYMSSSVPVINTVVASSPFRKRQHHEQLAVIPEQQNTQTQTKQSIAAEDSGKPHNSSPTNRLGRALLARGKALPSASNMSSAKPMRLQGLVRSKGPHGNRHTIQGRLRSYLSSSSGNSSGENGGTHNRSHHGSRSGGGGSILLQENTALSEENQRLRRELRKLRGEKIQLKRSIFTIAPKGTKTKDGSKLNRSHIYKAPLARQASVATRHALANLPSDTTNDAGTQSILNHLLNIVNPDVDLNAVRSASFARTFIQLCNKVAKILEKEERVLDLASPIHVFGDLHGNLEDLRFFCDHVWPLGMHLTAGKFLFLGDYVDRGDFSVEILTYLFAQKCTLPNKVFLVRGNHEMRTVNGWEEQYGKGSFIYQCRERFGEVKGTEVWEAANRVFDRLPLAAVIDNSVFCVHGGLPRHVPNSALIYKSNPSRKIPDAVYKQYRINNDTSNNEVTKTSSETKIRSEKPTETNLVMRNDGGSIVTTTQNHEVTKTNNTSLSCSTTSSRENTTVERSLGTGQSQKKRNDFLSRIQTIRLLPRDYPFDEKDETISNGDEQNNNNDTITNTVKQNHETPAIMTEDNKTTANSEASTDDIVLLPKYAQRLAFQLLWADPANERNEHLLDEFGFAQGQRGEDSLMYGKKAIDDFLEENDLTCIIRAHEATVAGVSVTKSAKVVTVFSTSKDHGCGSHAMCGYVLIDEHRLTVINRVS